MEERLKFEEAARIFREERDSLRAFEMLEAFLAMHPRSPYADDALLEQARIRAEMGEWKEASDLVERLLREFPSGSARKAAFLELTRIYQGAGRWKECEEASRSALSLNPSPEERFGLLLLGARCRFNRQDQAEALSEMIQAYRAAPDEMARLEAIRVMEEMAEGTEDRPIRRVLERSDGSEPFGILALLLMERRAERGENEEAVEDFIDIMLRYGYILPPDRTERAYSILRNRLLVRKGTVGVLLPLSGPYGLFGQKALQGIQAAFGFQAPLPGQAVPGSFSLAIRDSQGDPVRAAQAVRELAEKEQALVIIGPLFSRTTQSAALAAGESGIPLISLSPDPGVPLLGPDIFRRSLLDGQQVKALVETAHGQLGITKYAFLYPENSYGQELTALFRSELEARGGEVVASAGFQPGQTDFGPQIRGMVQLDRKLTPEELTRKKAGEKVEIAPIIEFQALFIPADFQTVGLLAPQLAFYDVGDVLLLGTDGWNSPWLAELGEHYVEGAVFTGGTGSASGSGVFREMSESYWLRFGEDPDTIAVQAYDAALIVRKGIESGSVRDRESLKAFILDLREFPSAEGPLSTTGEGDILQEPVLLTVKGGEIVPWVMEDWILKIEDLLKTPQPAPGGAPGPMTGIGGT